MGGFCLVVNAPHDVSTTKNKVHHNLRGVFQQTWKMSKSLHRGKVSKDKNVTQKRASYDKCSFARVNIS